VAHAGLPFLLDLTESLLDLIDFGFGVGFPSMASSIALISSLIELVTFSKFSSVNF